MRAIALVALHVFRDSVRDKVLYGIVLFAVLLIGYVDERFGAEEEEQCTEHGHGDLI